MRVQISPDAPHFRFVAHQVEHSADNRKAIGSRPIEATKLYTRGSGSISAIEHQFHNLWGCSSTGRALALQAKGYRFDPD